MAVGKLPLAKARLRRVPPISSSSPTTAQQRRRCIASYSHAKAQVQSISSRTHRLTSTVDAAVTAPDILAQAARAGRTGAALSPTYFAATGQTRIPLSSNQEPVDPNKAKLGKTLRILQDRMPTLLQSPLPQHILAPNISLQLFPSTHPHLPTVSGRVAYNAALWTSPIAWNRVPLIGNVRLDILAERMTTEPLTFLPRRHGAIADQLVVRWREKQREGGGGAGAALARSLRLSRGSGGGEEEGKAFTGLFIFDFDKEGRVLTHTIETAQEGGNWEKGMGAKFVGLTDWLLGGIQRDPDGTPPMPMFERRRRA